MPAVPELVFSASASVADFDEALLAARLFTQSAAGSTRSIELDSLSPSLLEFISSLRYFTFNNGLTTFFEDSISSY